MLHANRIHLLPFGSDDLMQLECAACHHPPLGVNLKRVATAGIASADAMYPQ